MLVSSPPRRGGAARAVEDATRCARRPTKAADRPLARRALSEDLADAAFHTRGADPATDTGPAPLSAARVQRSERGALRQLYGVAAASTVRACNARRRRRVCRRRCAGGRRRGGVATRPSAPERAADEPAGRRARHHLQCRAARAGRGDGSALVRMAEQPGGLAQIGVKRPADVARLRARLDPRARRCRRSDAAACGRSTRLPTTTTATICRSPSRTPPSPRCRRLRCPSSR